MAYDTKRTETERGAVEDYLATKYGITLLPKFAPPPPELLTGGAASMTAWCACRLARQFWSAASGIWGLPDVLI